MSTITLHRLQNKHPGLWVSLGVLVLLGLVLFAISFQLYQSRQNPYLSYDAQEREATR
jgi:hypothetical protein